MLHGLDLLTLPMPRFLNVVYAAIIEHHVAPKDRARLDQLLDWPPDVDTWGTGSDAETAQEAFATMTGGEDW